MSTPTGEVYCTNAGAGVRAAAVRTRGIDNPAKANLQAGLNVEKKPTQ